ERQHCEPETKLDHFPSSTPCRGAIQSTYHAHSQRRCHLTASRKCAAAGDTVTCQQKAKFSKWPPQGQAPMMQVGPLHRANVNKGLLQCLRVRTRLAATRLPSFVPNGLLERPTCCYGRNSGG